MGDMTSSASPTPHTASAIIFVPGIGGCELIDPSTKSLAWGLNFTNLSAGLVNSSLIERLRRTDLLVGDVIKNRSFLPGFGRLDPYRNIIDELRDVCAHPDAFTTYRYDWRQPVAVTALDFATFAHDHLKNWRQHRDARPEAGLCIVGHSMGGLVACRGALELDETDVNLIITLGTPFEGSVRAVKAIAHGDIAPLGLHSDKIREVVRDMASVYDLLPTYACLTSDPTKPGAVELSHSDLVAIGARADFSRQSLQAAPLSATGIFKERLVAIMGIDQPTIQSLTIAAGEATYFNEVDGKNWAGDGTVYRRAAYPGNLRAFGWPLQHGSMGKESGPIRSCIATIEQDPLGAPMGGSFGLAVPDTVAAGEPTLITVRHNNNAHIAVTITNPIGQTSKPPLRRQDDHDVATITLERPGLYEITASGGGTSDITCDVLVLERS